MSTPVGALIRSCRISRRLSQQELAEAAEIPRSAMNKIEHGLRRVQPHELAAIARVLTVDMQVFLDAMDAGWPQTPMHMLQEHLAQCPPEVVHSLDQLVRTFLRYVIHRPGGGGTPSSSLSTLC